MLHEHCMDQRAVLLVPMYKLCPVPVFLKDRTSMQLQVDLPVATGRDHTLRGMLEIKQSFQNLGSHSAEQLTGIFSSVTSPEKTHGHGFAKNSQ